MRATFNRVHANCSIISCSSQISSFIKIFILTSCMLFLKSFLLVVLENVKYIQGKQFLKTVFACGLEFVFTWDFSYYETNLVIFLYNNFSINKHSSSSKINTLKVFKNTRFNFITFNLCYVYGWLQTIIRILLDHLQWLE